MTQGDKAHVLGELSRTKTCTQAPPASPEHASFSHIPSAGSGAGRQVTGNLRGSSLPSCIFSGVLVSVLPEGDAKCKRFTGEDSCEGKWGRGWVGIIRPDLWEGEKEARKSGWDVLDCSTVPRKFGKVGSL